MNYWELRKRIASIVPRRTQLFASRDRVGAVREKGRKTNYYQFNIERGEWRKHERLLNTDEVNSFLEISVRAAACPMPLNLDVWDGLLCPFACRYCYADAFRAGLYTAFYDNSKSMGLRHCNPDYYKRELDKLMGLRRGSHENLSDVEKAVALEIPMRMGIRFEDFTQYEARKGVSLEMLRYLSEMNYPIMINTKSDLPGTDKYVRALASNEAGAAVHVTMITSDESIIKRIEPGAPSFLKRLTAIRNLTDAGVRAVPRIEPYLVFITDERDRVEEYIGKIKEAGARHITFDTYSYSANNSGIRNAFVRQGFDFERLFTAGCDSQALGSLLLDKFMDLFRAEGISCSSFDIGCAPTNSQDICCEVGDLFKGGFNHGSTVMAARYIVSRGKVPTRWRDFALHVIKHGGFLSNKLKQEVHRLWNVKGNSAYAANWAAGIEPCGADEDGIIWCYRPEYDHRMELLEGLI